MPITIRLCRLSLALAIFLGGGAVLPSPAAAGHEHAIYHKRQTWFLVDRNRDGRVSAQEWSFARDHGYDRLQGVPKKRLSRKEYQAYLTEYLHRYHDRREQRPWAHGWQHSPDRRDKPAGQSSPEAGPPWYVTRDGVRPWTYGRAGPESGRGEHGAR